LWRISLAKLAKSATLILECDAAAGYNEGLFEKDRP